MIDFNYIEVCYDCFFDLLYDAKHRYIGYLIDIELHVPTFASWGLLAAWNLFRAFLALIRDLCYVALSKDSHIQFIYFAFYGKQGGTIAIEL
jgi:hypothetical protein